MDSPPSSVRHNGNGKRIYHTISSVFSRKSSPVASSPEAPLSIEPPNFVPEAPILQPKSPSLSPQRKRQRIYNSISSAFSTLRADSPEPIPDDSELDCQRLIQLWLRSRLKQQMLAKWGDLGWGRGVVRLGSIDQLKAGVLDVCTWTIYTRYGWTCYNPIGR